jgi:hypothetical protein
MSVYNLKQNWHCWQFSVTVHLIKFQPNLSSCSHVYHMDKQTTGRYSCLSQLLTCVTAVRNAASFHQQNTQVSRKRNSVSSNIQAPVDGPMYKQISQMMILKWILRKKMGWYRQDLSCSERGTGSGTGPLMVLWVSQNVRNILTSWENKLL